MRSGWVWQAVVVGAVLLAGVAAEARVGGRPPAFKLPAVVGGPTGGTWRLDEHLEKKPVVVLFWATWCGPCRQELPFYQELYERYAKDGLEIVAVSMDDTSTITQAGPAARRLGVKFPVLSDLDTRVTGQLNPRRSAPFSIWIGRDGRVVWEREGFALAERELIAQGVADLVAGKVPVVGASAEAPATPPATPPAPAPTGAERANP
jgi:thiol-disulfide isomerase/thioredoxin